MMVRIPSGSSHFSEIGGELRGGTGDSPVEFQEDSAAMSHSRTTRIYDLIMDDDGPHSDLKRGVWAGTPWVIDVFTGSCGQDRDLGILWWLRENMGQQAWPYGEEPRPGRWYRGGTTVHGWTWYGFATEADMKAFEAAWPAPEPTP